LLYNEHNVQLLIFPFYINRWILAEPVVESFYIIRLRPTGLLLTATVMARVEDREYPQFHVSHLPAQTTSSHSRKLPYTLCYQRTTII
jgi:hypothetical protein